MTGLVCRAKLASRPLYLRGLLTFSLIAICMHHYSCNMVACTFYLSVTSCFHFASSLLHIQTSYYYAHNYNNYYYYYTKSSVKV